MGVDWPGRWVGEAAVVSEVAWSVRVGVVAARCGVVVAGSSVQSRWGDSPSERVPGI